MSRIKVSVLMPVFNAQGTLAESLDSILKQSLQDFEIVVVDDSSTDNSVEILRAYQDSRIRIIDNKSKGIVSALNIGLSKCSSNYIARMDADDVMHDTRLEKQYLVLSENTDITLCATQAKKFPEKIIRAGYIEYMRWQNACLTTQDINNQIYIESPFAHPSVMFRKDHIVAAGAYRDGEFAEDYELWLRLFCAGCILMKLEEVLLDWRESETRLSRTSSRYSESAFDILRADYLARDPRLQKRNIVFWGAGRKTRKRAQFLIDNGIKPFAWIDIDKSKVGNQYHGVETFTPKWLQQQKIKPLVLNYVRNHGAREKCQIFLDNAGYVMGQDYLDVA